MTRYLSAISCVAILGALVTLEGCSRDSETTDVASESPGVEQVGAEDSGQWVKVSRPWVRTNPVPGRPSAAFFEVDNSSAKDDRLTGVSVPGGGRGELHTHEHKDGIMRMFRIDSVVVPAGGQLALAPGGHHIMLFDLPPLEVGGRLSLILHFEHAGDVDISAEVRSIADQGPGSDQ